MHPATNSLNSFGIEMRVGSFKRRAIFSGEKQMESNNGIFGSLADLNGNRPKDISANDNPRLQTSLATLNILPIFPNIFHSILTCKFRLQFFLGPYKLLCPHMTKQWTGPFALKHQNRPISLGHWN